MTWVTWRQSRLESLIGLAVIAAVAIFLTWTGLGIVGDYNDSLLPDCMAQQSAGEGCSAAAMDFLQKHPNLHGLTGVLFICLPFVVGMLLATSTVLEFEQGTFRLAWTQGVTRGRWLATKIGYGLAVATIVPVLMVPLWNWRQAPFDALSGRLGGGSFEFEGITPIAYTIFAFSLCLTAGVLLRRSVPALVIGFIGFLGSRAYVADQLRPRFRTPITVTRAIGEKVSENAPVERFANGDWVLKDGITFATGQSSSDLDAVVRSCAAQVAGKSGDFLFDSCLSDNGIVRMLVYHPGSRFWTFQAIESGLFLGVAAVMLAFSAWWVTRRIA